MKARTFSWNLHHSSYHHFILLTFKEFFRHAPFTSVLPNYFVICWSLLLPLLLELFLPYSLGLFPSLDKVIGKWNNPYFMEDMGFCGSVSCLIPGSRQLAASPWIMPWDIQLSSQREKSKCQLSKGFYVFYQDMGKVKSAYFTLVKLSPMHG